MNPPTHLQNPADKLSGCRESPMLADVPQMTWFGKIKMLLRRFVDKMDVE
jgi:hypothetical protein